MKPLYFVLFVILGLSCIIIQAMSVHTSYGSNVAYDNVITSQSGSSQIIISPNTFSSNSQVDIMIRAPDFNSNEYAIDTIGDDDASRVVISTRESSIPYRLVESGPNTGEFVGYVLLSSSTSTCSPVCGPTDGFLAASGDDAITVSLIYHDGRSISSTFSSRPVSHNVIPEFPYVELVLITSMVSVIFFLKHK